MGFYCTRKKHLHTYLLLQNMTTIIFVDIKQNNCTKTVRILLSVVCTISNIAFSCVKSDNIAPKYHAGC